MEMAVRVLFGDDATLPCIDGLVGDDAQLCEDCGGGSAGDGTGPFVAKYNDKEGVRWSLPDGDGLDNRSTRRMWLTERQRPLIATTVVVCFIVVGAKPVEEDESVRDSWEDHRLMVAMPAFILVGTNIVENDLSRVQPRGLLRCFGRSNHLTAYHPTNTDNREHTPGFLGYQPCI